MSDHRVRRGIRTQKLASEWWNQRGHPECYPAGSGQRGKDIVRLWGHSPEVKAKARLDLLAALRQARANAEPGDIPYAWIRMNGQGEDPGKWVMCFFAEDIAPRMPGYKEPGPLQDARAFLLETYKQQRNTEDDNA